MGRTYCEKFRTAFLDSASDKKMAEPWLSENVESWLVATDKNPVELGKLWAENFLKKEKEREIA